MPKKPRSNRISAESSAVAGAWLLGAAGTGLRVFWGLRTVRRWRKESGEFRVPAGLPKVRVRIALRDGPSVPRICGWWRPVVLLHRAASSWDDQRLTAILWHPQVAPVCCYLKVGAAFLVMAFGLTVLTPSLAGFLSPPPTTPTCLIPVTNQAL